MSRNDAVEEYLKAWKAGQKEYKECQQKKIPPHPAVLDELLEGTPSAGVVDIGLIEIPIQRIVGTKSAGRVTAFTPSFRPLLDPDSEFGIKWINLCQAHLGDEGIRESVECYEYLGDFYVQEGNKRVSVLRSCGGTRISAHVKRVLPTPQNTPRNKAYQEFLEFYKITGLYDIRFTTPGSYPKLLEKLDFASRERWSEDERRRFQASYYYFTTALSAVGGSDLPQPEDALLMWLQVYPFRDLAALSAPELKKTIVRLWSNLLAASEPEPVVKTEPPEERGKIKQILSGTSHLNVAFVHLYSRGTSNWTRAHEMGRRHLEEELGRSVTVQSYSNANTPERAEELIERAVAQGAEVVFTTAPQLIGPCLKVSVKYPKVRFFNCSVHQPYASVQTYYSRIYEGKFITGAIAGAMCREDRIGYVGSYPIHGVPASINAFALGAQLTNPDARIELKWSCIPGNPTREFLKEGVRVISNRDTPMENYLFHEYGTYMADENGVLTPLGSPTWVWGRFYVNVVRSIMRGSWEDERKGYAINLWWGMGSGVIDVALSQTLPEGMHALAGLLKRGLCEGTLDPFRRKILDQQGQVRNDGDRVFSPTELLKMDWLCENVVGSFPRYEEILSVSRPMVDLLGVFPDTGEAGEK